MGLGSWISHAFGSDQEQANVPQAAFGRSQADAQMQRAQKMGEGFQGRADIQGDSTQQDQDYAAQQGVMKGLTDTINGNGPSVASQQMQQGTDASIRAQMAGAAGARGGGGNQALAGLQAQNNAAQAQQANVANTGIMRAGEVASARGQAANLAGQMRQGSQGWQQMQTGLRMQGRQLNDQSQLGAEQNALGYNAQAVQGDIAHMNAQAKANSENAEMNQGNSAAVMGAVGGAVKAGAAMGSDRGMKTDVHGLGSGLGAGIYDSHDRRPTLAHTITIGDPHGPTVQIHRHGGPHQGMRFGGKSPGRPGVDAPWDDREYDVASGHSWHGDVASDGDAKVDPIAPPPAWWGTHRTPTTLAQRMTDHESAQMIGQGPTHMAAEWREAQSTPGSGRYRDMGPTESRLAEIAAHRKRVVEEAEAERQAVDKRIGSPRVVSDGGAKQGLDMLGGGLETFGSIAGKTKHHGGGETAIPSAADLGVKPKGPPAVPEGGEAHTMKPGAKPDDAMVVGDATPAGSGAADEDEAGRGLGNDRASRVDFGPQGAEPQIGGANYTGTGAPTPGKTISDENAKVHKRGLGASEALTTSVRSGIKEAPVPAGEHPDYATYYDDSTASDGPHHTPHSQFFQRVAFHHPTAAKTLTSDKGAKTPPVGAGGPMVNFLHAIHPYSYEYKDGRDDTMGKQGAKRVGIIAQEADADPVGHTMIQPTMAPDGHKRLAINMGAGLSVALASDAALQEEIDALKKHLGIGGHRG